MESSIKARDRKIFTKKRLIQYAASFATRTGLPHMYCSLREWRRNGVIIIAYHNIKEREDDFSYGVFGLPTRQEFEEHIVYLSEKYEITSLPELTERIRNRKPLPKRGAVITFDDGYKNVYTYAYPILRKYHVPATIFLTTIYMGTDNPFWWDKVTHIIKNITLTKLKLEEVGAYSLATLTERRKARRTITKCLKGLPEGRKSQLIQRMETLAGGSLPALNETATLSWNQIEEMSHHDITFGSHTATHPILTRISPEQANHEIYRSKKDIEEHLGKPVNLFSYPNGERGDFNDETKRLLKDNGYTGAVSLIPGTNTTGTDPYELRRFSNVGGGLDIFKLEISGIVPHFVPALLTGKI